MKSFILAVFVSLGLAFACPQNPMIQLTSVTPNLLQEGALDTQLHLVGKGFVQPVTVAWIQNSSLSRLATVFVDSTDLLATVPGNLLRTAGSALIFAQVGQNQTATQSLTITIGNVVPTLTGCAPCHVIVGAPSPTITLTGTNFNNGSVVNWNTTALTTTFVSSTSLTAVVPQALYATVGTVKLSVSNGGAGGGTSAQLTFSVVAPLAITTATLPGGSLGTPYTATLVATGGTTPYTWTISAGSLPAGLSLNASTGVISGTPTAAGTATFTIQVTDTTGALARKRFE